MLSLLKRSLHFLPKVPVTATPSLLLTMSSGARTLRSTTSSNSENESGNHKKITPADKKLKKKPIKKEIVSKDDSSSFVNDSKVKRNVNKEAKTPKKAQKVAAKKKLSIPKIVITEHFDADFSPKSKVTNNSKTGTRDEKKEKVKKSPTKSKPRKADDEYVKDLPKTSKVSPKSKPIKKEILSDAESKMMVQEISKVSPKSKPIKNEALSDEESKMMVQEISKASPRKRKTVENPEKSVKMKTGHVQDMEDIGWQPENWRLVLDNILQMRKQNVAPVDYWGCEECPEKEIPPEVFRYQSLISVMLSSQTRDEVTYAATQRLIQHGLTVDSILNTPDEKIGELIYPAGFWKSKVKFIKNTTQILKDQYNGDIPRTFKDLCKLPGVGPKMANIVMSVGWKETVGIAVDTHVHRISNRLGWVPRAAKDPEQTRKALEAWLPKDQWNPINITLVGFGQTICKPVGPSCNQCLNSHLCPFGKDVLSGKIKKSPKKIT